LHDTIVLWFFSRGYVLKVAVHIAARQASINICCSRYLPTEPYFKIFALFIYSCTNIFFENLVCVVDCLNCKMTVLSVSVSFVSLIVSLVHYLK